MRADRTRPVRFTNRRCRRIAEKFRLALESKVRVAERAEAFEAEWAPHYRDYGRRVEDADRARAIREADKARYVNGDTVVEIVDGRIVILDTE
jgi:hypothetical protein